MLSRSLRVFSWMVAAATCACGGGEDAPPPAAGGSTGAGAGGAGGTITAGTGGSAAGGGAGGNAGTGGMTAGTGGATAGTGGMTAGTGGATAGTGGMTAGAGGATAGIGGATAGTGGATAGTGGAGAAGAAGSAGAENLPPFSFFVTSMTGLAELSGSSDGFGGDFSYGEADGLSGADKICRELAEASMAGAGQKQWRAFLSVTGGPAGEPVNAIDRVGTGPWYDRLGRIVAMSVADLLNARPRGADPLIINDLPNEFGVPNSDPNGTGGVDNHHVITGSNENGELDSTDFGSTCNDWTSAEPDTGRPQCGFSWPRGGGGGGNGSHWITGFSAYGCAPGVAIVQDGAGNMDNRTVGEGGGYGAFYCFALTP